MKKILLSVLALISFCVFGATTTPVQLLNPTGSTSGKTILSTGASSAPAWGNLAATSLAAQGANTVVANVTSGSASPSTAALPSCSASGNALLYTSGTGFSCGTGYALTSGATFTGAIIPSQTIGVTGTTTNNDANAGALGEYATNSAAGVSLTTSTNANIATLSLTAGDWDVEATTAITGAGGASITTAGASVSTTSVTFGGLGSYWQSVTSGLGANGSLTQVTPTVRESLPTTTTVYCVANATFSSGTASASCLIRARRVR